MNRIMNELYTFEDKTSDEVLLINGFQHINQLIPYINDLQKQNIKLKDNRNKLKEWLEEETIKLELHKDNMDIDEYVDKKFLLKKVLEKLQEIEGGMNE